MATPSPVTLTKKPPIPFMNEEDRDDNIPRPLTKEEIADILSVVPDIKSASDDVGEYNHESMLETLKEQLSEIVVTPLGIEDMKSEFQRQFNDALIAPGTVVGVTAAEALGQPITQMALNSFHKSGSSKNVTYGVDRIRELINASKELKTTSCSIFFKNQHLTVDDVILKVRPDITEIGVSNLVKGIPDIETGDQLVEPWWYQPYRALIRSDFKSNAILKLTINTNMLYAYKINMEDIAQVIEQDRQSVICVYSPMSVGEIHIYPVEKEIIKPVTKIEGVVDAASASMVFLWNVIIPALDKLKISGISGIRQIYPVEAPVLQIIKDEKRDNTAPSGDIWFLILNPVRMKITGITSEKLQNLCRTCGVEVVKVRPNYIGVKTPNGESPLEIMNRTIKADKEAEKQYEDTKRKEGARVIRRPPTDISNSSQLVYADSDGSLFKGNKSTLRTLLSNPNIDSTRTYCNNVHEIKAVLGIEAARSFLIKEFYDVISYEGAYINPRHIVLLVDFMVSLGEVYGITFSGISRQPIGALEKASFQNAMGTFAEASAFGEVKEVKGTSASIYVGKRAEIGTEFSKTFMDKTKFKEIEEEIEANPNMQLDVGAFTDAINELTNFAPGDDFMVMEGAEEEMFGAIPGQEIPGLTLGNINMHANKLEIAGPLIRAPELELAATKLNNAPCILPNKVENIPTVLPPIITTGGLGLPAGLLPAALQPLTLPAVLQPLQPVPVVLPTPAPVKKVTFNLDTFLGN